MSNLPNIYGFNKTSEAGQDVFAYSIFLQGCNFRCPYCMNARLVRGEVDKIIPIEEIKKSVKENDIEWVMISGGEPTITEFTFLTNLLEEIKSWGCKIGMSTNGSRPEVLEKILKHLNFVALDIKSSKYLDYQDISEDLIMETKGIVKDTKILLENSIKPIDYELRTTLYPPFFRDIPEDIYRMSVFMLIKKRDRWIFQQFRHNKNMLNKEAYKVKPFNEDQVKLVLEEAKKYCNNVSLRYV